jgi:ATP-binding cassette subfamily B protein
MLGYYKVKSGAIYINGSNIGDISLKEWRKHCGVVMQDGYIFSESIKQNIAIAENRIDMNRVYSAAKIANIYDFIESLPLKFDTIIGNDGTGLSQGQRQRILIARAVYKNPDFIFLDEATNSLDAKNEKQIVEKLNDFYKGRTVVIVAHRLSTVKNADQIVVLADGKVQEIGTHEELISVRGAYYELVSNQLELGS